MAPKGRNMFYENKKQETTEIDRKVVQPWGYQYSGVTTDTEDITGKVYLPWSVVSSLCSMIQTGFGQSPSSAALSGVVIRTATQSLDTARVRIKELGARDDTTFVAVALCAVCCSGESPAPAGEDDLGDDLTPDSTVGLGFYAFPFVGTPYGRGYGYGQPYQPYYGYRYPYGYKWGWGYKPWVHPWGFYG
ncbi:hypothetical protein AAG570_010920 [Ranatra chinensis]|uniref:Uncharacterized protein n=1 Tax=Ranatra chinensis TaxID=642074 RepID=A0ABD0YXH8_9HEMI